MKIQNSKQAIVRLAAILVSLWSSSHPTHAAEYCWRASWGVFPDQVDSTMLLGNDPTNRPGPVLTNGELVLRTYTKNTNSTDGMADYQYYGQAAPNVVMPAQLVIEADVQLESGSTTFSGRPPAYIVWVGAAGVLGMLGMEEGSIFLGRNHTQHWDTVSVPSGDGFHHYRIEVDSPTMAHLSTSQVRVYRDFQPVPILQAFNGGDGANAAFTYIGAEIYFGDGTDWAFGVSRWRSFRHNAASSPSRPVMFIRAAPDEVCWSSCPGALYSIHYCSQLSPPNWLPLFANVVGSGDITCVTDPLPRREAQRFYRVEVQR